MVEGMTDVTDATFERDVLERSDQVAVVVDLWAPWCGPCRSLGPLIEKVVSEHAGEVELAKVNVDDNPQVAATFQVQSIPAVYALRQRQVVDGFIGALPEAEVRAFVARILPQASEAEALVAAGDEESLRKALELEPGNVRAVVSLASLLLSRGEPEEVLALLERVPETAETARLAAEARLALAGVDVAAPGVESHLDQLLARAKDDDEARRELVDFLQALPPEDPRVPAYRKALAARLF